MALANQKSEGKKQKPKHATAASNGDDWELLYVKKGNLLPETPPQICYPH